MMVYVCILLFVFMLLMPFFPGWLEIRNKRDNTKLAIDTKYVREPRYFARSFRKKLMGDTQSLFSDNVPKEIFLSKEEKVICADSQLAKPVSLDCVCFFSKPAKMLSGSSCKKEVYALENLSIGDNSLLRAAACEKNCVLGRSSRVVRWIDAEEELKLEAGCRIDMTATAGKILRVSQGCTFKRLYAPAIYIEADDGCALPADSKYGLESVAPRKIFRGKDKLEAHETLEGDVVVQQDLHMDTDSHIVGSVKSEHDVELAAGSIVCGNVFAEGDVLLRTGAKIMGTIFSQGKIVMEDQCSVGTPGKICSVIARKGIELGHGIKVYGYISTEENGKVR